MICVGIDVAKDKHDCFINSLLFGDMYMFRWEMESRGWNGSLLFCMKNKSPAGISGRAFASCSFLLKFHQTMDGMTDQIPNGLRSQA